MDSLRFGRDSVPRVRRTKDGWLLVPRRTVYWVRPGVRRYCKYWVKRVLEVFLGVPPNTDTFQDEGGAWALRPVEFRWEAGEPLPTGFLLGELVLDGKALPDFNESQFYLRARRTLVVAYIFWNVSCAAAFILGVEDYDLDAPENRHVLEKMKSDYERIRVLLREENPPEELSKLLSKYTHPKSRIRRREISQGSPDLLFRLPRRTKRGAWRNPEKYSIRVAWSAIEKCYIAWIPELRSSRGGSTPEEAIANLRESRDWELERLRSAKHPVPKPKYFILSKTLDEQ